MSTFVELPIYLIDGKLRDLDVPTEEIPAKLYVRVNSIIAVREAMDDNDNLSKCIIHLEGGENYFVDKNYADITKILLRNI